MRGKKWTSKIYIQTSSKMILCIFLPIVHEKNQNVENNRGGGGVCVYNTVSHLCFFATLNKEQKSSYLQLCRRLNGKMLVFGCLYSKSTPIVLKKKKKNAKKPTCQTIAFSLNTNKHKHAKKLSTENRLFTAMTPSFCSLTDTEQSLQYTIETHLSGPTMPKFDANMNYIHPSPPSSMKQCNKSATVKFRMEAISQSCDTIRPCHQCLF